MDESLKRQTSTAHPAKPGASLGSYEKKAVARLTPAMT